MDLNYRCEVCDHVVVLKPKVRACPTCGTTLPTAIAAAAPKPPPPGRKKAVLGRPTRSGIQTTTTRETRTRPRKRTAAAQLQLQGSLIRSGKTWKLRTVDGTWPVKVDTEIDLSILEDRVFSYDLRGMQGNVRIIRPRDTLALRTAVLLATATPPPTHGRSRDPRLGPQPAGTSPLELMQTGLGDQLREIERLQRRKNDPYAWNALASGYRVPALRGPLESAMTAVGWERIDALVRRYRGDWPDGLLEWLDARRTETLKQQKQTRTLHSRAWLDGDYGTMDD